jgi:ABC-2 type transport system permease protein
MTSPRAELLRPDSIAARLSRISGALLRDLYSLRRHPPRVVEAAFWPTLELLTWGCVSLFLAAHQAPSLMGGLLGAVMLWQMSARPQGELARGFLEDVWAGNTLNVFAAPIATTELLIGLVLSGLLQLLLGVGMLALLAALVFGFHITVLGPALIPYALLGLIFAWSLGIGSIAMVVRFGHSAQTFAWLLAATFQPFSAVFFPVTVLPGPLRTVAHVVPASYIFEDMRAVLAGADPDWANLATAGLLDLGYLAAALVLLAGALRHARVSGRLSRFA